MGHRAKHKQKGFTIQEMLLVILITVVLLAVSVVAIVSYMKRLRLTELDNAAKEIFMAAQNRAILLDSGKKLEKYVVFESGQNRIEHVDALPGSDGTTQITAYYIAKDDRVLSQLLPKGSVDPVLRDGDFYIIYEPKSGSVVDVLFSKKEPLPTEGDFPAFYKKWRTASKDERMDSDPMIGYYGGEPAQSGATLSLRTPVINIYNENTLRAEITYWVPRTLAMIGQEGNVQLKTELAYQGESLVLDPADAEKTLSSDLAYKAHTYTWTLDGLEGVHFREMFAPSGYPGTYGDDFTLTAEVFYTGDLNIAGASKTAQDNSLFAKGSDGETAYIACLRHLQNLDVEFSQVAGKKSAVQKGDVPGEEGYIFRPIHNDELQEYRGENFSIYDLDIRAEGERAAGLFGAWGGREGAAKKLQGIHLVDTKVSAAEGPAGALVGEGVFIEMTGCQVYWENRSDQATDLRNKLGDSAGGLRYQITGGGALGGLAGRLEHTTIKHCSASTLVQGSGPVGGLVGEGRQLTLSGSYGASYLKGPAAGGLVGELTESARISGSYGVGFIDSGGQENARAAGLCLGDGTAAVERSYSAMLFTNGRRAENFPLCQRGSYRKTYYLASELFHGEEGFDALAQPYSALTDPEQWDRLFGRGTFAFSDVAHSHPYNLQTTLSLTNFIYPGIKELDHWGDWGAQFQDGRLVYYECYTDGSYGFQGGDVSHLEEGKLVAKDGYAVAYRSTDSIAGIGITLQVTYETAPGKSKKEQHGYGPGGNDIHITEGVQDISGEISNYYLLPLAESIVNSPYAARDFYQKITIEEKTPAKGRSKHTKSSYYYNPHFAKAILPYQNGLDLSSVAKRLRAEVRSPRHLYMLSRYPAYYNSANQYRFLQQLDVDYRAYTGYDLFTGLWSQTPIGRDGASPFRGSYYGNGHPIIGVRLAASEGRRYFEHVGLFGYSTSVLRDIVLRLEESPEIRVLQSGSSSATIYAGGLVGYNGGTVQNCAVSGARIKASCYNYSRVYLGGLAGRNEGTITGSAADGAHLEADASMSDAYVGGFVGRNTKGALIDRCYAVGKAVAGRARYGTVYACGFAGRNEASLRRSYAALSLTAKGGSRSYGFSPDRSEGCVYLDKGNFTYRGESYAAQYTDPAAQPVTWAALTGKEPSEAVAALGMRQGVLAADFQMPYPYPGIVTNSEGAAVHYGQWPDQMDLGSMGVYYWEKLSIGQADSYHFSAISAEDGFVSRSSTLSKIHGDGGIVTEYGYGYFYRAGTEHPSLHSEGIFWNDERFDQNRADANQSADRALFKLMSGRYHFNSYNAWDTEEARGLHLAEYGPMNGGEAPAGAWTLRQGNSSLRVRLNPFFANALAEEGAAGPGSEENPYEVRSVSQLRFINWNEVTRNTTTVLANTPEDNTTQFPYLSYGKNGRYTQRSFHWEQTHDLDGEKKSYTPIAEFYDPVWTSSGGTLFGWFGGVYNGNDYVIADMNIKGQTSSCVGLFGAVFDGTLKNIVLHSTDGRGTVTSGDSGSGQWYAIGGVAGLAGSSSNSAVINCAVTGYTIEDIHKTNTKGDWGGTGLGGLIGVCEMDLKGCTAVTDVRLASRDHSNIRVGGLVGSCQGVISSCYSGGSITVGRDFITNSNRGIYVGGIVGGIYMKPLKVGGSSQITVGQSGQKLQNTLENCYSYTVLPASTDNRFIKGLYAVGGSGELNVDRDADGPIKNRDHGWTNYENSYYLASEVLKNNNGTIAIDRTDVGKRTEEGQLWVTGLEYEQMADSQSGSGLLQRLNANGGGFSTVTTETADGAPINGRYSFGSHPSLLGKDYPFPTILTQASEMVDNGRANVHYGDWPLAGIRREHGALPVSLDLFSDYQEKGEGEGGEAVWLERLALSGVSAKGQWSIHAAPPQEGQEPIVEAQLLEGDAEGSRMLKVIGREAGSTVVTVSYETGGRTYTLPIEVNVTAQLYLTVKEGGAARVFSGGQAKVPLELCDQYGKPLPDGLKKDIAFSQFSVEFDGDYVAEAAIEQEPEAGGLTLSAMSAFAEGSTQMTGGYAFTYLNREYRRTSVLTMYLVRPEIELPPLEFIFKEGAAEQVKEYTAQLSGFSLAVEGQPQPLTDLRIADFEEVAAEFKNSVLVDWKKDPEGNGQEGTLSVTAYPQELYPTAALVKVCFQFQWEGSLHTMWQDLTIRIDKESEEIQP